MLWDGAQLEGAAHWSHEYSGTHAGAREQEKKTNRITPLVFGIGGLSVSLVGLALRIAVLVAAMTVTPPADRSVTIGKQWLLGDESGREKGHNPCF